MNWRGILGIVFICGGAALTIIAMATLEWRIAPGGGSNKTTYGLVNMNQCRPDTGVCSTQTIAKLCSDYPSPACDNLKKGGQQVIACGVCSLVLFAVGFLCMYFAYKWGAQKWRLFCNISWLGAGGLAILAVFLYSKLAIGLDYAFILYLFSAFTSLIGATVVLLGPGVAP